jgi:hypothetical protein
VEQSDLNTIVAVSAVLIAFSSLGVSIWQGFLTRKHNRLSVKPSLRVDRKTALNERPGVILTNKGIETAVIKEITVYLDGNLVDSYGSQPPTDFAIRSLGYQEIRVNTWVSE